MRLALAALTAFLLLAAPARAATASVEAGALRVAAAPGEANSIEVAPGPPLGPPGYRVSDRSASLSLTAGTGCAPTRVGEVACPDTGITRVEVDAGDADDSVGVEALLPASLRGGEGDDRLSGSAGPDRLDGGRGQDAADGGGGDDAILLHDRKLDTALCGDGRDRVRAEVLDWLDFDCERVDYGPPGRVGRLRPRTGGGRFVAVPGHAGVRLDRRILRDVLYLIRRYKVRVIAGYALRGHSRKGEHPLGLAVDLMPGPGGSWRQVDRLARWAEPRQDRPRLPFSWVGYNGDADHGNPRHCKASRGCPPHLHLSWSHTPGRPGRPVRTVWAWDVR